MNDNGHILLFDGVCNLCNSMVQFVIRHDRRRLFRFAALQSPAGQALLQRHGLKASDFDSFVYLRQDHVYQRSTAALLVCRMLGGGWKFLYVLRIIPRFLRDGVYNIIARNRYRLFGQMQECMIPSPELKALFLDNETMPVS